MNPSFHKKKIDLYKKKIYEKYRFLGVSAIYYKGEKEDDIFFCQKAHNIQKGRYYKYSIYDSKRQKYTKTEETYKRAKERLIENLEIFDDTEKLTFFIKYNEEKFRVNCESKRFITHIDSIHELEKYPTIFNTEREKILSLIRLEYEIELFVLNGPNSPYNCSTDH